MKYHRILPVILTASLLSASITLGAGGDDIRLNDEQLANDQIYCAIVANDVWTAVKDNPKRDAVAGSATFWDQRRKLYSAVATALTSYEYISLRASVARLRRKVQSQQALTTPGNTGQEAESALRICDSELSSDPERLKKLLSTPRESFVPELRSMRIAAPNENWGMSFDAPILMKISESNEPNRYSYWGSSGDFNLSVFVETPKCNGGNTNAAVHECFMKTINSANAISTEHPSHFRVERKIPLPNMPDKSMRHINYLFSYGSKWMDVHISGTDTSAMGRFEETFRYGQ